MNRADRRQLAHLLEELAQEVRHAGGTGDDIVLARRAAAKESRQTGQNYEAFLNGTRDYSYGVRCVLAGIEIGRKL